ncbi:TEA-domain-containing protein [Piedraia hortae CBS 480.64]|uniref:TEA-domain-containing protein n=1 Tax=Piedraia hortae CBS 480.64 TaxID=1314780 RepID=A0A6A7BUD4_9PEZI|nr:TEA-domain-containing protein [Piedraia hortae CBS 480.64]
MLQPVRVLPSNAAPGQVGQIEYAGPAYTPRPLLYGRQWPTRGIDEQVEQKSRSLWKRFESSESYKKYRNRQHKGDQSGQEQKWPDQLEQAFFRAETALVKYPPMGRRKALHKDKQRGRNELIADHIYETTGVSRTRKQVSSHIQVLKPFVEHDPQIMKWLSKEDMGMHSSRRIKPYTSGRRMSTYPSARGTDLATVRRIKHYLDIFEPTSFSMFIQRGEHRLHTYSQSLDAPLGPDLVAPNWQVVQEKHPQLYAMHFQRPLDCNILVADCSLSFPTESFKDTPLSSVELGISFVFASRRLAPSTHLRCRNTFYRNGQVDGLGTSLFDVPIQIYEDGLSASMKFGSTFWARTLAELAPQRVCGDIESSIRGISVVQEVVVMAGSQGERILILVWRFRPSSSLTGRASWRRLCLPSEGNENLPPVTSTPGLKSPFNYGAVSGTAPTWDGSFASTIPDNPSFACTQSLPDEALAASLPTGSLVDGSLPEGTFDSNAYDFTGGTINLSFADGAFPECDANQISGELGTFNWENGYGQSQGITDREFGVVGFPPASVSLGAKEEFVVGGAEGEVAARPREETVCPVSENLAFGHEESAYGEMPVYDPQQGVGVGILPVGYGDELSALATLADASYWTRHMIK